MGLRRCADSYVHGKRPVRRYPEHYQILRLPVRNVFHLPHRETAGCIAAGRDRRVQESGLMRIVNTCGNIYVKKPAAHLPAFFSERTRAEKYPQTKFILMLFEKVHFVRSISM